MGIPRKVQKLSGSSEHEGLFLPSHVAPGLTETSTVPLAVQASGLELGALMADLVRTAIGPLDASTR